MEQSRILFVEYPRCTTCKRAKRWLDEHDVDYEDRHIVEENPNEDELRTWHKMSGLPIRRLFNTSGMRYRELNMKDRFAQGIGEDECYALLASDGMLVKRPIVVGGDFVLVGFNESAWSERMLR